MHDSSLSISVPSAKQHICPREHFTPVQSGRLPDDLAVFGLQHVSFRTRPGASVAAIRHLILRSARLTSSTSFVVVTAPLPLSKCLSVMFIGTLRPHTISACPTRSGRLGIVLMLPFPMLQLPLPEGVASKEFPGQNQPPGGSDRYIDGLHSVQSRGVIEELATIPFPFSAGPLQHLPGGHALTST